MNASDLALTLTHDTIRYTRQEDHDVATTRGDDDGLSFTAEQKREAQKAWNDAKASGRVKLPDESVIAAVRAKIFNPKRKDKPLKLIWSEERGWFFPTKEELFRQQCTVTNKLRKSESLMAQELARLKSVLEKRDAHIETLEKSLVQLSIEWYTMGEENKKFAAAHMTIQEQRKHAIFKRIRNMVVSKAFNKWRHEVDSIVQAKMEETLEGAEEAIEQLQEELHETRKETRKLERYVEDRRSKFIKMMLNAPLSRAFRTWAANIGHSKVITATKKVEAHKEIVVEAKREVKKAERDVRALEAELAKYKGIVMEQRRRSMSTMVAKMRMAGLAPAFSTWKSYVYKGVIQQHVEQQITLEERVEKQQETVRRVQRVLNKAQAAAVRKMRNAPYLGAWNKWKEYVRDRRVLAAVAESTAHKEEIEELELDRRRLWGVVRTMGARVVRKTFKEVEGRYFAKWRAQTRLGRMLQMDRALRSILHLTRAKAFRHWRGLVREKVEVIQEQEEREEREEREEELEDAIEEIRRDRDYWENLANRNLAKLRKTADYALKRMYHGAAYKAITHWHKVAKIAKHYGHLQAVVDRAKSRALERIVHRLLYPAFSKWKNDVAAWNREKAEEEADEMDRALLEARDETRRWREAAERGWAAVQRMGHRALRRMINAHLWRAFGHWKKWAQAGAALKDYRRRAEARVEELERRLYPLEAEVGALRLFKDAMASSERTMIMRKGGGFIALEEYVATVENRISAAALEEALEGKARGEEMAERYGLKGALTALRGAAQAEQGEVLTPRGGHTSWRHAPQMGGDGGGDEGEGGGGGNHHHRRSKHHRGGGGPWGGGAASGGDGDSDDSSDDNDENGGDFGRYQPRISTEAQFGNARFANVGGLSKRSYGPGHSRGGKQRAYEPPTYPNDVSLKVKYKAAYGAGPDEREPLAGDTDRLGTVGGIGAGAVSRKKLLRGKIAIDVERAQKLSTRTMNLAYDPPRDRFGAAVRDVYDDAAGGADGGGQLTDRSDAASWRSGHSGGGGGGPAAALDSARSVQSNTSGAPPIGFSDVGSVKHVSREEDGKNAARKAKTRGALREAAKSRDADTRAAANRRKTASAWIPDASDPSDEDESKAENTWATRRRMARMSDAGLARAEDAEIDASARSHIPDPAEKKRGAAGIAGGARVSGKGLRDPGWDTDSEDRLDLEKLVSGAETTDDDDDDEYVPLNRNRVR